MAVNFFKKLFNKKTVTLVEVNKKYPLPLIEKEELTHDTRRFRFGLPSPKHVLGIPLGQHISLSAMIDNEPVVRVYTPITTDLNTGYVDIVVKIYFKTEEFPNGGKMSLYLENLKIGDKIDFRGPVGKHRYSGNGRFIIKSTKTGPTTKIQGKRLNMISGGSGITPMYQLIKYICQDPKDSTQIRLLFANKTDDDILLRKQLEALASSYPKQFQIWYTVGQSTIQSWSYSLGRINEEMIREHLFPSGDDVLVLMCGPAPMIDLACKPALEKVGFQSNRMIVF